MKEQGKKTSVSVRFGLGLTLVALTGLAVLGGSTGSRTAEAREQVRVGPSPAGVHETRWDDADQVTRLPGHPELDLQLD